MSPTKRSDYVLATTQVPAQYAVPFGQRSEPGQSFQFPDFILAHRYWRDLNAEEQRQKDQSNAEGIDGGASMTAPFNGFEVRSLDGKSLDTLELSILPYASEHLTVNGKKFMLRNDQDTDKQWVVRQY